MSPRPGQLLASRFLTCVVLTSACATHGDPAPRESVTAAAESGKGEASKRAPDAIASATPSHASHPEGPNMPGGFDCPDVLVSARKGGSAPDRYVTPSPAESAAFARLFAALRHQDPESLVSDAARLGFQLSPVSAEPGVWALVEASQRKRGGGAYLLRPGSSSKLIVQAPHTFFDEGTLPLACELFQRSNALSLFIETAHRYKAAEANDAGNFPADLAHAKDSLFQAATDGLLRETSGATLIQLHGFGPRESDASVVLSSGETAPSALVDDVKQALSAVVGGVRSFPTDTHELGATTNVQAELARSRGARFLHVEMSAPLRAQLLQAGAVRARFLDALLRGLGTQ